jgi:Glycosyltransferase family 87
MVWRRGDTEESYEAERPTPWRRGAETTPHEDARRVALEGWDEELTKDELQGKPPPDEEVARAKRKAAIRHLADLALFALAVIGALAGIAVAWMHILGDPLNDARPYYEAASRLNAGQPLYPAGLDANSSKIYLYPPLFAIVLRPLALLPYEWFVLLWELVVVGSFVLLLQRLGVRRRSTWIAIGLLGVPIGWALSVAQAHVPMTLLMAIGQPWSIAIAANLKLFPALILLYWLGRRDWESAAAFLVWAALLALAQAVLASGASVDYIKQLSVDQLGEQGVLRNFSPYTISPVLWLVLIFGGAAATIVAARYRWGWAVAVTFASLAPPRLLVYMLTGLLAAVRRPRDPGEKPEDDYSDPAAAYRRATR